MGDDADDNDLSASLLESEPSSSPRLPAPPPSNRGASLPPPGAPRLSAPPPKMPTRKPPPGLAMPTRPPPTPQSFMPEPPPASNDLSGLASALSFGAPSRPPVRGGSEPPPLSVRPKAPPLPSAPSSPAPASTWPKPATPGKLASDPFPSAPISAWAKATPAKALGSEPPPPLSSGSVRPKPPPLPSAPAASKPPPSMPASFSSTHKSLLGLTPATKNDSRPPPPQHSPAPSLGSSRSPAAGPFRVILERLGREIDARAETQPTRAAMLLAAQARIFVDGMGDPMRAMEALARASELAPEARFVASTQRWMAEQGADPSATLHRLRVELAHVDGKERVALLWYIASIQEYAANDLAGAEDTMREVLALDPADPGAWDAIAALRIRARALGEDGGGTDDDDKTWSGVLEALGAMAQATDDAVLRGALHGSAGALQDRFFTEDEALASLRRALDADPANVAARATIQSILLRRRDWDEYVRVLVVEAGAIEDPRASRERWERAGDVYAERLGDHTQAAQCYLRAAALAETDPGPLEKLAALLESAGRFDEARTAYEKLLLRLHDPQAKSWALVRLGKLREQRKDKVDDALAAYRLAVETAPTFTPAVNALIAMAQAKGHSAIVLDLERREADRIVDPRARAVRWSALADRLEASGGAREEIIQLHERVLALEPTNSASFEALDRMYRTANQWPRVIGLYESAVFATDEVRKKRALRLELAEIFHARMNEPARAAELLQEVLAEPEPEPVARFDKLVALGRALADAARWTEHIDVLAEQAELLHGAERIATLYRIGAVVEARTGDSQRALTAYAKVLEQDPKHEAAALATLRIHEREGTWEQAIATRRLLVALAPRPEDATLGLIDIARIQEERLGKTADAIATYTEALEKTPTARPVLTSLERLLRASGQHEALAKAIQRFAETSSDHHEQVRLLLRAAIVLELCVEDRALAAEAYGRALDATIMSGDVERYAALWGAMRIHDVRGDWAAVDRMLIELLDLSPERTARLRVLVRLARVAELRLDEPARAAKYWEEARDHSVDRIRVARVMNRAEDIREAVVDAVTATTDKRLARGLLRRVALAAEHENASDDGATIYERLLSEDAADTQALDGTIRCAAAAASVDDAKLAKSLMARARVLDDVGLRALHGFAAAVIDDTAGRTSDAEVSYQFALIADPQLLPALDAARALRAQAGDWAAVAVLHERAAHASVDPDNAARSYLDAAEVHETRLGSSIRALASYRALLDLQPEHPRAFARALELLEAAADWHGAVKVLQSHAEATDDPAVKAKCYTKRAGILAARLGATPGAIADLRKALALRPDDEDVDTLETLALLEERVKNWQEALQLHGRVAEAALDGPSRRRAKVAQARIYEEELAQYDEAEAILNELAAQYPDDREVRLRLAMAAARGGREERALEIYGELGEVGTPQDRVRALVELAALVRERPDKWPAQQADSALAKAFDLAIDEPAAIATLEDRFAKDGDFRPFVAQGEAAVARVLPAMPGLLPMRTALARAYRERLGNPEAADRQLIAAIQSFPDSMSSRMALASSLRGRNDDAALTELRGAVKLDPFSPEPFKALVTFTIATGRPELGVMMASAASLLGATGDEIEVTLDDATPLRPGQDTLLLEEAMNRLVGPSRCWPLRAIFRELDPFLPKLFPGAEQLLAQSPPLPESIAIVGESRAIAAALGAQAPVICRGQAREAVALNTEPRALILGQELIADAGRPIGIFQIAYVCARLASLGSIYALPRDQIRALLDAVLPTDVDSPLVRDMRKRVSSVLPRKNKKDLERVVAQATQDPRPDLPTWEAEEGRRALLVAVVMCRDLRAIAKVLVPDAPDSGDAKREALMKSATLREMLEFCVSPQAWDVFRRLYGRS